MTLDMANFSIGVIKPDIVACSIEYEKTQFKQLLETNPGKKNDVPRASAYTIPIGNTF